MTRPVLASLDPRGVASVTLNRPEVNNAYNGAMIEGLLEAMDELAGKPELRVVLLKGSGKHFQAGADLKWIREVRDASAEENERVSRAQRRKPSTGSTVCRCRPWRWCKAAASAAAPE